MTSDRDQKRKHSSWIRATAQPNSSSSALCTGTGKCGFSPLSCVRGHEHPSGTRRGVGVWGRTRLWCPVHRASQIKMTTLDLHPCTRPPRKTYRVRDNRSSVSSCPPAPAQPSAIDATPPPSPPGLNKQRSPNFSGDPGNRAGEARVWEAGPAAGVFLPPGQRGPSPVSDFACLPPVFDGSPRGAVWCRDRPPFFYPRPPKLTPLGQGSRRPAGGSGAATADQASAREQR